MAKSAMAISVKTDLRGDDGQGRRLALRTIHGVPLEQKTSKRTNKQPEEKLTLIFLMLVFQQLI